MKCYERKVDVRLLGAVDVGIVWLTSLAMLVALSMTRLAAILGRPGIQEHLADFLSMTAVLSCCYLAWRRTRLAVVVLGLGLLFLTHSFAHLYTPSLRWGVPAVDYLLHNQVSSHYSFNQARLYLGNIFGWLVAGLAFVEGARRAGSGSELGLGFGFGASVGAGAEPQSPQFASGPLQWPMIGAILLGALLNVGVLSVQGLKDINFLAQQSGSAIGAGRAPALLEDGGASAVVMATLVAGIFGLLLLGRMRPKLRLGLVLVAFGAAIASSYTAGRVFFMGIAAAGVVLVLTTFAIARYSRSLKLAAMAVVPLVITLFTVTELAPPRVAQHASMLRGIQLENLAASASGVLRSIDPVRFGHQYTMFKAFLEHPYLGNGVGSFYAVYHQHFSQAQGQGAAFYPDPPSSLYLMLLEDLGISGLLVILLVVGLVVRRVLLVARGGQAVEPMEALALGMALNLLVCWLVGVHVIFTSVSAVAGIAFAVLWKAGDAESLATGGGMLARRKTVPLDGTRGLWFRRCTAWAKGAVVVLPLLGIVGLWVTAPRAPEFRWQERGQAQMPLGLVIPIEAPEGGRWVSSGVDYLFDGGPVRLFVEMPPEKYPLRVTVKFYDQSENLVDEVSQVIGDYLLPKPGRQLVFQPSSADLSKDCGLDINAEHYCSFKISTSPSWTWEKQRVAAYLLPKS